MSAADVEKVRSRPRWKILRQDNAKVRRSQHPGEAVLPARVLTISHVHELGNRLATEIGAQEPYRLSLGVSSNRPATWTELRTVIPEELSTVKITATGHLLEHPENGPNGTQWQEVELTVSDKAVAHLRVSGTPQGLEDQHRYSATAESLGAYFATLGEARRDQSWFIPVLFWLAVAVAVLPLLWLVIVGSLPWGTLPFFAATGYVAAAYLSEQVGRWSDRHFAGRNASIIDTRPIEEVRLDREQARQRRQVGLRYAMTTGVILAVVAALLRQILP
jgi:hypothetical protein